MPIPEPEPAPRLDPASYDDAWDDPELFEEEQAVGRVLLPPKREQAPTGPDPVRNRNRVEMGLQIGAKIRTGRPVQETEETDQAGVVVKLDCPSPDQPFQANHMIVPRRDQVAEPPPEQVFGKPKEEGAEWGKRPKQSLRWLIGAGTGVVIILVLAIATQELWIRATPDEISAPKTALADADSLLEVEGFEIDGTSEQQSRALLATIAKAGSSGEILQFIRNRDALVAQVTRDWQPWGTPPDWDGADSATWQTGNESGRGFGLLTGFKPDLTPFQAYFVREQGILKLDWEATTGASANPFSMLVQGKGTGGKTRAIIKPDSFFTDCFPESLYRSFKLLSPDLDQVVWAYTKLGSGEDSAIMAFFPSGILLENENGQLPMTVILAPPAPGAQKNQWLITEMLHNDWVSP